MRKAPLCPCRSCFVSLGPGGSDWRVSLVLLDQIGPRLVSFDSGGLDVALLVGQGLRAPCWHGEYCEFSSHQLRHGGHGSEWESAASQLAQQIRTENGRAK